MNIVIFKRLALSILGVKGARLISRIKRALLPKSTSSEEQAYIKKVISLIQDGDHVIDIGANEGLWTTALANKVGSKGEVYAFEPVKEAFKLLSHNTRKYGNVRLFNIGVSDKNGHTLILRDPVSMAPPGASIMNTAIHINNLENLVTEEIEISTLDHLLSNRNKPIKFIKIDVEGHEKNVIEGGLETIKRDNPILFIEILREYWATGTIGYSEVTNILLDIGYEINQITPSAILNSKEDFQSKFENFLFLPKFS